MTRARLLVAIVVLVALAACNDTSLPPGGTYAAVSGVVLDGVTNQPVAGATVTIDAVLTQKTGADGKFSFGQVPVGDIDVDVQATGYKAYSQPSRLDVDKPLSLTITLSH